MDLSTGRWGATAALAVFLGLAAFLLRDGFAPDHVMLAGGTLDRSLPWLASDAQQEPHNRFVGDQARIFYPYLLEAARVYAGEADPLWTTRGGGGLPFLGNMTSSLLHPLTLLAAVVRVELVPLLQGLAVLTLSAFLTFLFLRRLGLRWGVALCGGLAFGFGGHQVLWLQYALSHTLVALPACFWATELVVEDRSRRRVAVLAGCFSLLVLGGHPETTWVSGVVAGMWALWRLWDAHGRFLVVSTAVLAVALTAVQWVPFLDYALDSHGMTLRAVEAERDASAMSWGAAIMFSVFFMTALALLKVSGKGGLIRRILAIGMLVFVIVMARRMGMALAGGVIVLPGLYGSPVAGGEFVGAQDFPGLNAGYVGVLPVVLLATGAMVGLGGGFVRFFGVISLLLWGAAFHMPGAETFVRALPGFAEMGATRLLGPVAFLTACGGAKVLEILCAPQTKPGYRTAVGRVGSTLALGVGLSAVALLAPVDPSGGETVIDKLISPKAYEVFDGRAPIPIQVPLDEAVELLTVSVDEKLLFRGPAAPGPDDGSFTVLYMAQRAEEGVHRVRVVTGSGPTTNRIALLPIEVERRHRFAGRDLAMAGLALMFTGLIVARRRRWAPLVAAVLVGVDVATFADGYNTATPVDELYAATETVDFLQGQQAPFRIFTEGNTLPPDTQVAVGVDHLLSYDNLGLQRTYQWLLRVPIDMDAFASFSFDRHSADYGSPRFDTLDVRYVLTGPRTDLSDIAGMRLVHESETRIWENTDNLGRAYVVSHAERIDPEREAELLELDIRRTAFLEQEPPSPLGGEGKARVISHDGGRVVVEVEADGPAMLVLVENRADGWVASIDGGPAQPTLACNVAWQALAVPAGRHEVVFSYEPSGFRWGLRISLAALGVWLLMLLLPRHLF